MDVKISFRGMEHTQALDELINSKSQKFSKWFSAGAEVKWVCWVEGKDHISEVKILDHNKEFFAKAESEDLYKTIDLVIQKIQNQLN
ncbi:MAG TPA: ribosome-associated translation inhibitor RaiA [Bacteriovoracaceae bacterium]|nr:ribosome-associated translation inhibitor RaiA [Bacteriovoracaceae bacterium]